MPQYRSKAEKCLVRMWPLQWRTKGNVCLFYGSSLISSFHVIPSDIYWKSLSLLALSFGRAKGYKKKTNLLSLQSERWYLSDIKVPLKGSHPSQGRWSLLWSCAAVIVRKGAAVVTVPSILQALGLALVCFVNTTEQMRWTGDGWEAGKKKKKAIS